MTSWSRRRMLTVVSLSGDATAGCCKSRWSLRCCCIVFSMSNMSDA